MTYIICLILCHISYGLMALVYALISFLHSVSSTACPVQSSQTSCPSISISLPPSACTLCPVIYTPLQRWSFAEKNRFFYECLTKKVLNRNSAPINKELIDFPKGEDKITSICFMISDGEVPPDVVPTAYCHSKSLNTHTH